MADPLELAEQILDKAGPMSTSSLEVELAERHKASLPAWVRPWLGTLLGHTRRLLYPGQLRLVRAALDALERLSPERVDGGWGWYFPGLSRRQGRVGCTSTYEQASKELEAAVVVSCQATAEQIALEYEQQHREGEDRQ